MDDTVLLKFAAAPGATVSVSFEPIGSSFSLSDGDFVHLRTPAANVGKIEVVVWPNGISVEVPYPDEYAILNRDGDVIDWL
ncbi:hypothetical protein [Crossiella sp. CA198]|uniref:hypothetical protein n=1 Tax=Crossiella sp. CA198 TaxID=3455607 RepID=UPI003F8D68B0